MLTRKQKELFVYLNNYISSNDISPSFEEMKNAVNLKSKSGIHRLITSLEQRGYIKRLKHKARAMEITKNLPNKNVNNIESSNDESFLNIPLVGSIAAGEAIEAINSTDSSISIPRSLVSKNSTYFGLKVSINFGSTSAPLTKAYREKLKGLPQSLKKYEGIFRKPLQEANVENLIADAVEEVRPKIMFNISAHGKHYLQSCIAKLHCF